MAFWVLFIFKINVDSLFFQQTTQEKKVILFKGMAFPGRQITISVLELGKDGFNPPNLAIEEKSPAIGCVCAYLINQAGEGRCRSSCYNQLTIAHI